MYIKKRNSLDCAYIDRRKRKKEVRIFQLDAPWRNAVISVEGLHYISRKLRELERRK